MRYKSKLKGSGGYGLRSNYLPHRDPYSAYRQRTAPETDYDRKLKNSILQSELTGPSRFVSREPSYRNVLQRNYEETKSELKEADEFTDNILKAQLGSFSEVTGNSEVPQEKYLEMKDQSIEAGQRFLEMKEFPDVFEAHQKEFGDPIEVQKKRNFGDTEIGF